MAEQVSEKLDAINKTLEKILKVLEKPDNPVIRIVEIAAAGATILGIFHVVDVMIKWITGG